MPDRRDLVRLKISRRGFYRGSRNVHWGRFGGGWNWNLGFMISSFSRRGTLIINLLFGHIRFDWDFTGKAD